MPQDPVPFMLQWLEQKKTTDEDKALSPEEKERLIKENKALEQELCTVRSQMQECAKLAADEGDEEEEEDDDADEEPPEGWERPMTNKARQSVSAEAYGEWK